VAAWGTTSRDVITIAEIQRVMAALSPNGIGA
jgi:hypothetical protein